MPARSCRQRVRHNWPSDCGFLLALLGEPPADASWSVTITRSGCKIGCGRPVRGRKREVMGLVARLLGGMIGRRSRPRTITPGTHRASQEALDRKGRQRRRVGGARVTTVFDVSLAEDDLKKLAALLKQRCGTGGTVKDGRIKIQGDQRERIVAELEKLGYKVKRVGG